MCKSKSMERQTCVLGLSQNNAKCEVRPFSTSRKKEPQRLYREKQHGTFGSNLRSSPKVNRTLMTYIESTLTIEASDAHHAVGCSRGPSCLGFASNRLPTSCQSMSTLLPFSDDRSILSMLHLPCSSLNHGDNKLVSSGFCATGFASNLRPLRTFRWR